MAAKFHNRTDFTPPRAGSALSKTSGLLQRQCACGSSAGVSGDCPECQDKFLRRQVSNTIKEIQPSASRQQTVLASGEPLGTRALAEPLLGHDFGRVPIHSLAPATMMGSHAHRREIFLNGPGDRKGPTPPARAASCPTDIKVAQVGPANDIDFGKNGFLTGWGGISLMEVSDPSGKSWDGTAVHENLKNIKNSCGNRGKNACSNVSDEQKGAGGSTFKVGAESNFLGKAKLPAVKNKFYDLHVFATKDASLLHELKKDSCEVQCEQSFDCGGKRFGPDFIISYQMTRDVVKAGTRNINVTRVAMNKAAVVKQAAPGNAKP